MTTSRGKNDTAERPTNRLRGLNIWAPTCTLFFTFRTKIVGYQRIWPRWRTGKHQEGTETHASRFLESVFTKGFEKGNQHRCYLSGLKQSHYAKTYHWEGHQVFLMHICRVQSQVPFSGVCVYLRDLGKSGIGTYHWEVMGICVQTSDYSYLHPDFLFPASMTHMTQCSANAAFASHDEPLNALISGGQTRVCSKTQHHVANQCRDDTSFVSCSQNASMYSKHRICICWNDLPHGHTV